MTFEHTLNLVPRLASNGLDTIQRKLGRGLDDTWQARARTWFTQVCCGLSGHEHFLHGADDRICLRCWFCGHESPGLTTAGTRPIRRYAGNPEKHRLQRLPSV
jgi:hypothetical protein